MSRAVAGDRTNQQLLESTHALRTHHQKISPFARLYQCRARRLFGRLSADDDIGRDFGDMADRLVHQRASLVPDLVDRGSERIADGHGEHPGRDNVEDGAALLRLGDSPIERSCAFPGAVYPDNDAMLGGWRLEGSRIVVHNDPGR